MSNIFVFRLENGYYYIGTGDDVNDSFHVLLKTSVNKPIGIEKIIESGSIEDLISLTKTYYDLYGREKVRSPITIDYATMGALEKSRKQSLLLSQAHNYGNVSQNITVLDYMISLKNSNIVCRRRCSCINRICPVVDTDSD
jgi:hypothetical protein